MSKRSQWMIIGFVMGGIVLLQNAWLISVPPYAQMDEIDHAYRAAAVAQGEIIAQGQSKLGRGDLVTVPASVVRDAGYRCLIPGYYGPGNCYPLSRPDKNGNVLVASAAARYDPVYYLAVGPASLLVKSGAGALIAMRIASALLCDAVLLLALIIAVRCARSLYPVAGVIVAAMPVALCASATVAPNGLEMAGGILMWTAALAFAGRPDLEQRRQRLLLWAFAFASSVVMVTHSLGPVWVLLSLPPIVLMMSGARWRREWTTLYPTMVKAGVAVFGVALASSVWTLSQGANSLGPSPAKPPPSPALGAVMGQMRIWAQQLVGMVPYRNQAAPVVAYVLGFGIMLGLVALGLRFASRRVVFIVVVVLIEVVVANLAFALIGYPTQGWSWQGRYALPLAYGLILIPAWVLDTWVPQGDRAWLVHRWVPAVVAMLVGAVNAITLLNVFVNFETPWWSRLDHVPEPPRILVALLCLGATAAFACGALPGRQRAATAAELLTVDTGVSAH